MLCKGGLSRYAVSVCVCPSRSCIVSKRINISSKFCSLSGSHTILVFLYQMAWRYSDRNPPNGGCECRWGRQKSGFSANIWLHRMLRTLQWPAAMNKIVGRYLAIDRCLLELVLSTDGGPSSGVSQLWCKSVYGTESHASVNTTKRREHNFIYAAVNLTREYN